LLEWRRLRQFLGGQWQIKNGTTIDTYKIIPGIVQTASTTLLTIIPNGQTNPVSFTLTSDTVMQPKNSTLAADDKVVVVTVNDVVKMVIKITINESGMIPPGLRKHEENRAGKDTPPGWCHGKKTGWGEKTLG